MQFPVKEFQTIITKTACQMKYLSSSKIDGFVKGRICHTGPPIELRAGPIRHPRQTSGGQAEYTEITGFWPAPE